MIDYRIHSGDGPYDPEEAKEFLARIFGPNYHDSRRVKDGLFESEPSTRPENMIAARTPDGELIGLIRIVERYIRAGSVDWKTGFITSVAVHPKWQGRGICGELVRASLSALKDREFDLSGVIGRRAVDGLYPKYGFAHVARYLNLEIISPVDAAGRLEAEAIENWDADVLGAVYDRCYMNLAGSFVRDDGIWRFLREKAETSHGAFRLFSLKDEGRPVGYIARLGDSLIEAACDAAYFADIPPLLRPLGIDGINLHPLHPLFRHCRNTYNTMYTERFAMDGGYMAQIVRPDLVMQKLGPVLAKRADKLPLPFQKINLLGHEIFLGTGDIAKSSQADHVTFDRERYAVQLMLGFQRPGHIPGIHFEAGHEAVAMLFPNQWFHTPNLDEV